MQAAGSRAHSNAWTPNAPLWPFPTSVILHAMICCWAGDNRHYWNTCLEEKRSYGGSFYTSQGFKLLRLMHRICHSSVTVSRLHWLDWISIMKTRPLTMQMLLEVLQIHPPVPPYAHPEGHRVSQHSSSAQKPSMGSSHSCSTTARPRMDRAVHCAMLPQCFPALSVEVLLLSPLGRKGNQSCPTCGCRWSNAASGVGALSSPGELCLSISCSAAPHTEG